MHSRLMACSNIRQVVLFPDLKGGRRCELINLDLHIFLLFCH